MTKFYPLRVSDIRRETPDTVSVAFEVPEHLRDTFRFVQGQHLTLRTTIDGAEVRRAYSICTGVQENELRVAIKQVEGGLFGTFASERLKIGDTLESMPPPGPFFTELPGLASLTEATITSPTKP